MRNKMPSRFSKFILLISFLSMVILPANGWTAEADLAKQLSNPIADLISIPFQGNYDGGMGSKDEGQKIYVNVQPVIPVSIAEDWNMISRTVLPVVIEQKDISPGSGTQSGLGDTVQSLWFSPKQHTDGGLTWGLGPAFLLPTGTDDLLGARKWGAGPTGVALYQIGPWTCGALANHLWDFAGDADRPYVNSTFLQPFLAYNTPNAWTFAINSESTYDWRTEQWSIPINGMISKLIRVGSQPISLQGGVRYWAESPDSGPSGWGFRLTVTFLFPK